MRLPTEVEVRGAALLDALRPFALGDLLLGFKPDPTLGERAVYPPGLVEALEGTDLGRWCVCKLSDGSRAVDFAKLSALLNTVALNALERARAMEALHNQAELASALRSGAPQMHGGGPHA